MLIPYDALSDEALEGLVSEFVSRDGTDYGESEVSMSDKASQVMAALKSGEAVLVYDPLSQSTSILSRQQWRERQRAQPAHDPEAETWYSND